MSSFHNTRPLDIVDIKLHIPSILIQLSYATKDNFCGEIVPGYNKNIAYLQVEAVKSLKLINSLLRDKGLVLYIFDAYRPVRSVNFFNEIWRLSPTNLALKEKYYPEYTKDELFKEELLATRSSHSRASTLDLSLYDLTNKCLLDMGTCFDYFHQASHTNSNLVSTNQAKNRQILKNIMEENGFINYSKEWWHFRYKNEKYNETYFDFEIG